MLNKGCEVNVNATTFLDFVMDKLCPNLLPFNGINLRSMVVLGKILEPKGVMLRICLFCFVFFFFLFKCLDW